MTQNKEDCSLLEYKIALKLFIESKWYRHWTVCEKDTCGKPNHKSYQCHVIKGQSNNNQSNCKWCNNCKCTAHTTDECRKSKKKTGSDTVKTFQEDAENLSFVFKADYVQNTYTVVTDICNSILVDCGATAHIITSKKSFISMNDLSKEKHIIELTDGSRSDNVVLGKDDASVSVHDNIGVKHHIALENALYIQSYKQNILFVQAAVRRVQMTILVQATLN